MGFFDIFIKKNSDLEACIMSVANNAANNYKDAAQKYFKEFLEKYEELKANHRLSEKQIAYYDALQAKYERELKGFRH